MLTTLGMLTALGMFGMIGMFENPGTSGMLCIFGVYWVCLIDDNYFFYNGIYSNNAIK